MVRQTITHLTQPNPPQQSERAISMNPIELNKITLVPDFQVQVQIDMRTHAAASAYATVRRAVTEIAVLEGLGWPGKIY